ncbi:hypothetical protein TELCIR_09027, partial [Teladorsagia circumcincta]
MAQWQQAPLFVRAKQPESEQWFAVAHGGPTTLVVQRSNPVPDEGTITTLGTTSMERVRYDSDVLRDDLSGKLVQFMNAKVLRNEELVWDHVWVRDGKIIDAANVFYEERRKADIQVNCGGQILSPGFIDIQINGGFGVDFSSVPSTDEEYKQGVAKVSRCLLSHGVTSYLPTVITSPPEVYAR